MGDKQYETHLEVDADAVRAEDGVYVGPTQLGGALVALVSVWLLRRLMRLWSRPVFEMPPPPPAWAQVPTTLSSKQLAAIAKLRAAEEDATQSGIADARAVLVGPQYTGEPE